MVTGASVGVSDGGQWKMDERRLLLPLALPLPPLQLPLPKESIDGNC